jgi:hypothetical protein
MCSHHAWYAAARRSGSTTPAPPAWSFSTSWDDPRVGGVGGGEVGIAAGGLVAAAVAGEVDGRLRVERQRPHRLVALGRLVDVVAEEQHEVDVRRGDVAVRRPVTVVVALARRHGHRQRRGVAGWRRSGRPDHGLVALGREPVRVGRRRLEAVGDDVHAVAPAGLGHGVALGDGCVAVEHLPAHVDVTVEAVGDQPGPEGDGRAVGVAGRHADDERVRPDGLRRRGGRRCRRGRRRRRLVVVARRARGEGDGAEEELAAGERHASAPATSVKNALRARTRSAPASRASRSTSAAVWRP